MKTKGRMEKSVSLFDTVRRIGDHPPQAFSEGEAVLHGQTLHILHLMSEGPWRFLSEGGVGQLGMTSRTHVVSRLCKQGEGKQLHVHTENKPPRKVKQVYHRQLTAYTAKHYKFSR